jgi:hypothetical protein
LSYKFPPEGPTGNPPGVPPEDSPKNDAHELSLKKMEALLRQSSMGIHLLFDNQDIARAHSGSSDPRDFLNFEKMKRVQDVMTELVRKNSFLDKLAYLRELDEDSYTMLIRTYFHLVENSLRAVTRKPH